MRIRYPGFVFRGLYVQGIILMPQRVTPLLNYDGPKTVGDLRQNLELDLTITGEYIKGCSCLIIFK